MLLIYLHPATIHRKIHKKIKISPTSMFITAGFHWSENLVMWQWILFCHKGLSDSSVRWASLYFWFNSDRHVFFPEDILNLHAVRKFAWPFSLIQTVYVKRINAFVLIKYLPASIACWYLLQTVSGGRRSGPTKRRAWSESKLFDTLRVFVKEFFEKHNFEKKVSRRQ